MTKTTRTAVLLAIALAVVACGDGSEPSSDGGTTTTLAGTTSTEGDTMPQLDPDQDALVVAAKTDLAQRLRVAPEDLKLVSFKDVTWPDGSLGCPQPGMSYTQALVEGYQIALGHQDRLYDYHGANGDEPFLCKSDEKDGGYGFVPPPGFND